jgi:hypothetical protein
MMMPTLLNLNKQTKEQEEQGNKKKELCGQSRFGQSKLKLVLPAVSL